MIQNYVFFFDARMQYAIKENKDAARQIFLQAGQMLSNSVKNVALMAVSGKRIKEIATVMVHNLFDEDDDASAINLFNRIWIWWNKDKIIAEKKAVRNHIGPTLICVYCNGGLEFPHNIDQYQSLQPLTTYI